MEKSGFDSWAVIELMGHQRIAGRVTEAEIGGGKLLRVDIPATARKQAITKYFGTVAVYAITPCDEETARMAAAECDPVPVNEWSARRLLELKDQAAKPRLEAGTEDEEDKDEEDRPF